MKLILMPPSGQKTIQLSVQSLDTGTKFQYPSILQSRSPSPSQGYLLTASTLWSALEKNK